MTICLQVWQKPLLVFMFMAVTLQSHLLGLPNSVISKTASNGKIHDLIQENGLPRGLIPDIVRSFTLSDDGHFQIILQHPCYVQFEELVYYDRVITGRLVYGSATDVTGIQARKFFVWLSVTGIEADFESDMVKFYVGFLSVKLPAKQFQEIPVCKDKTCTDEKSTHPEAM